MIYFKWSRPDFSSYQQGSRRWKMFQQKFFWNIFTRKKFVKTCVFQKTLCVVANLFQFLESRARRRKKRHFAKKAMITPQMSKLLKMRIANKHCQLFLINWNWLELLLFQKRDLVWTSWTVTLEFQEIGLAFDDKFCKKEGKYVRLKVKDFTLSFWFHEIFVFGFTKYFWLLFNTWIWQMSTTSCYERASMLFHSWPITTFLFFENQFLYMCVVLKYYRR